MGNTNSGRSPNACVSIGRISTVQFIRVSNCPLVKASNSATPCDFGHVLNVIEELQIHVPGDPLTFRWRGSEEYLEWLLYPTDGYV